MFTLIRSLVLIVGLVATGINFCWAESLQETVAEIEPEYRNFNATLMLGTQQFTGKMGETLDGGLSPGMTFGFYLLDSLALQLSYVNSKNNISNAAAAAISASGTVSHSSWGAQMKYYFRNMKNKPSINPYVIGGISQNFRNFSFASNSIVAKDDAFGFDGGFGIEIPLQQNRVYIGLQALYKAVEYPTENLEMRNVFGDPSGFQLNGDQWSASFLVGMNL